MGSMMDFQSLMEKEKKTPKAIQKEIPMERLNSKVKEMEILKEIPMERLSLKVKGKRIPKETLKKRLRETLKNSGSQKQIQTDFRSVKLKNLEIG